MLVIIVDTYGDILGIKKEYPSPMEYMGETDTFIQVKIKGMLENIDKSKIKSSYKIKVK